MQVLLGGARRLRRARDQNMRGA
uniref:Uncharacterized protein n=1 Tax=Arundo donax TaxID=35708 RepID=A0A0A9BLE6_ARUDO